MANILHDVDIYGN